MSELCKCTFVPSQIFTILGQFLVHIFQNHIFFAEIKIMILVNKMNDTFAYKVLPVRRCIYLVLI